MEPLLLLLEKIDQRTIGVPINLKVVLEAALLGLIRVISLMATQSQT